MAKNILDNVKRGSLQNTMLFTLKSKIKFFLAGDDFIYKHSVLILLPISILLTVKSCCLWPGRVAQSVGHLTCKSEVLGSIPGLATYFRFSLR